MKVTTEELERCEVLLTLEIEPEQQEKLLKKAAQRISREVNIPGFRPGKAPYNVVVRRFGLEAIQAEALEQSVEDLLTKALAEVNVTPFAQIRPEKVEWQPNLTVTVRIPTRPVVELGNYRDTRLEVKPIEVTDEDVAQALKFLQEQRAAWTPVDRPAQLGDLISMTVTEKDGDEVLSDHEAVDYELTEINEAGTEKLPDLTTPLLGLSAGESKTFLITYPESFDNPEYAGKNITFEVEVSGVKQKELDPLDDEFAKQLGDFETLEALKARVQTDLENNRHRQYDFELGNQAIDKIVETAEKIEWPLAYEDEQVDHEIEHLEFHLKEAGLTLDGYLSVQNKSQDDLRQEVRETTVKQLKRVLVMSKLAELEKLGVNQMEVLQQAKFMADMSGQGDRVWQNILASESRQNALANDILSNKIILRLAAIARGEAPDLEAAEPTTESSQETASTASLIENSSAAATPTETELDQPANPATAETTESN